MAPRPPHQPRPRRRHPWRPDGDGCHARSPLVLDGLRPHTHHPRLARPRRLRLRHGKHEVHLRNGLSVAVESQNHPPDGCWSFWRVQPAHQAHHLEYLHGDGPVPLLCFCLLGSLRLAKSPDATHLRFVPHRHAGLQSSPVVHGSVGRCDDAHHRRGTCRPTLAQAAGRSGGNVPPRHCN